MDKGSEKQVINRAKSFRGIKEAYVCFGLYDLILKIKLDSTEELKELLIHKYRRIKNGKKIIILCIERKKEILPLDPLISLQHIFKLFKRKNIESPLFCQIMSTN